MRSTIILLLAAAIILSGCTIPLFTPGSAQCGATIDWVNFVKFNGIEYVNGPTPQVGRAIEAADLGPEFARVQFKVSGNVCTPDYRTQDGHAGFLEKGTPVFTIKGYKPEFRLAAWQDQRLVVFEADTNPQARVGADLLDLDGKVRSIGINSTDDGTTELAAINDPQQVAALVKLVLQAPVDQNFRFAGEYRPGTGFFIAFHFNDGTAAVRSYSTLSNEMQRGMLLPPEFAAAITQAVAAKPAKSFDNRSSDWYNLAR